MSNLAYIFPMAWFNHQADDTTRFPKNCQLSSWSSLVDVGQETTFPIATSEIAAELPATTATGGRGVERPWLWKLGEGWVM